MAGDSLVSQAGAVPAFFAGMLPEGRRLTSLRRLVKTSADDELSLLLAVGRDVIGDVQVVPEGETPTEAESLITVQSSFSEVRFSEIFADAGLVDRTGLPGVQDKASARMMSVPVAQAAGRYILKVDPPEFEHLVENEHYFLSISRAAGIPTTEAELVADAEGRRGLLVRRFDRLVDAAGATHSRACEDACQLMNRWPAGKYNVSAERLTAAVARVCAAGPWPCAMGIGNCVSRGSPAMETSTRGTFRCSRPLRESGEAPVYHLPSTLPYGDLTMALSIQGSVDGLSRAKLLEFAGAIGMTARTATATLDDTLEATATVTSDFVVGQSPLVSKWCRRGRRGSSTGANSSRVSRLMTASIARRLRGRANAEPHRRRPPLSATTESTPQPFGGGGGI